MRKYLPAILLLISTPAFAGWLPRGAYIDENPGNYWKCQSGIATRFDNVWYRSPSCTSLVYGQWWSGNWSYCSSPWWLPANTWRCDDPGPDAPQIGPVPVNMGPMHGMPASGPLPGTLSSGPMPNGAPATAQPGD